MTYTAAQRDILRGALSQPGAAEVFAIDNRETFDALKAAATEYLERQGDVDGRTAPIARTELHGGLDQVVVLRDLAQHIGFEVLLTKNESLFVRAPGRRFGVTVTVDQALRGRLGSELAAP